MFSFQSSWQCTWPLLEEVYVQVQKYTEYILFQRPSIALVFNETHNMLMVCFHNKPENSFFPGKCNQRLKERKLGESANKGAIDLSKGCVHM